MHYAPIVRVLAWSGTVLAAACGLSALVAIAFGEAALVPAFLVTALILVVTCCSVLLLAPRGTADSRPPDGLGALILFWLLSPFASGIVFFLAVPGAGPLASLAEAASCLTTTGHTVLPLAPADWPVSLVFWRGCLHLLGALVSLTAVASIFAAINLGGPGIHRTVLFTIPEGSFFGALPRVVFAALLALGGTVLIMTAALALARAPLHTALSDAVSVATTGLVVPGRHATGPTNDAQGVILFLGLLFSTIGLAVILEMRAGRWWPALRDPELVTLLVLAGGLVAVLAMLGERLVDGAGWTISELSTAGLPVNASGIEDRVPLSIALVPTMIGGSALSTAGGIKLARIFVLNVRTVQEFRMLAFRRAVGVFSFRGRVQPEKTVLSVWVYLVGYVFMLAAALLALSMTGLDFDSALASSVGLLSNAGHLVTPLPDHAGWLHLASTFVMITGRLEVLAAVPALVPDFWRR